MSGTNGKILLLTLILILFASMAWADKGRIYGKIYTDRGEVLEGVIRWDKNEVCWEDMIDGTKERERPKDERRSKRKKYKDGSSKVRLFGFTVFGDDNNWYSSTSQAAISFGFIKRLTVDGNNSAEILLKSGEEVLIQSGSTDLGTAVREIIIETDDEGELELEWDDIEYIEFMDGGDVKSSMGVRIYGTVTTDRAGEYTGWICWDMDEALTDDIIDGRDRRRKRKIRFEKIKSIEKISSQASEVVTKDGKSFRLDDSNDVDSGNRGITVSDSKMGRVIVEWDEFEKLEILDPPSSAYKHYNDFDGGERLFGTVYDEDGEKYTGIIRWDNDEEYGWEILDGEYRGVDFDITMESIKSIEKLSRRSSRITLFDGRDFRLRESNDVNDDNKGIYVYPDGLNGDEVVLEWEDFDHVEFKEN
ncbi:MAG: hypothetical protein KAR42_09500 [candidate division Zixibacteria bacterium]|nr:hypothetical protein [candidate division Zixibacteria bacterium]